MTLNKEEDIVLLTCEPISVAPLQQEIFADNEDGKYGAVVSFCGLVREVDDRNGHQEHIQAIDYEAYTELFVGETRRLLSEVRELLHDHIGRIAVVHRVDRVHVGQVTAAVVVSSVSRKEALAAIELITEGMRKRVPIWKKVVRNDGQEHLVRMSG